jgi:hypothetical protein
MCCVECNIFHSSFLPFSPSNHKYDTGHVKFSLHSLHYIQCLLNNNIFGRIIIPKPISYIHKWKKGKDMALTYSLACPYIKLLQNPYWGILLYTVQHFRLPFPPKYNHFIKQHIQSCSNLMYLLFIEMINP